MSIPPENQDPGSPQTAPSDPKEPLSPGSGRAGGEQAEYLQLMETYGRLGNLPVGEVVKGTVLEVTKSQVLVDIGYKSEGLRPLEEFQEATGPVGVRPGERIEVLVEKSEDQEGHMNLSRSKAERMQAWENIQRAFENQEIVRGVVVDRVKGGLSVNIGLTAFLPGSQIDSRPVKDLDGLKGKNIECKIIKVDRRRANIVLSRKLVVQEETARRKRTTLLSLREGSLVEGIVKNITNYGVFVDLGRIDGLLHITDISWNRVSHPSRVFKLGEAIKVKVLEVEPEKERVSLGYKQLTPDPWTSLTDRLAVGVKARGKVVSLTDYGAFVEIEQGVEGLLHASELSWNRRIRSPSRLFRLGDMIDVMVLDINVAERKLSLGLKQLEPDPWAALPDRLSIGSVVSGKVRNLTDFGAFVEVMEGIDGLVHISDLSWSQRLEHPSEILKRGETVEVVVLNIDVNNHRLSLGLKQLKPNPWEEFFARHGLGDLLQGRIVRLAGFGAFVELESGVEALCHASEFEDNQSQDTPRVGEERSFRVIRLQPRERRIGLSLKEVPKTPSEKEPRSLRAQASATGDSPPWPTGNQNQDSSS